MPKNRNRAPFESFGADMKEARTGRTSRRRRTFAPVYHPRSACRFTYAVNEAAVHFEVAFD